MDKQARPLIIIFFLAYQRMELFRDVVRLREGRI